MSESFAEHENKNWAIAVVHGLGTPDRGETMLAVCEGIKAVCSDFMQADKAALDDEAAAPMQHWTFRGSRAKVAEAFWGDLSLVRGNFADMIRALCINLYGAVYVNSRILQKANRFARLLPVVPFYLIRWIVFPLHVLALCIAVPFGFRLWVWKPQSGEAPDYLTTDRQLFLWTIALCVVAGFALTLWLLRRQRRTVRLQPWDIALLFTAFSLLSGAFGSQSVTDWFKRCVESLTGGLPRGLHTIIRDWFAQGPSFGRDLCDLTVASTPITKIEGLGKYFAVNEFVGDTAFFLCALAVLIYILLAVGNWVLGRRETAHSMFFVATVVSVFVIATAILLEVVDFITRAVQFAGVRNLDGYWYELGFVLWLAAVAIGAGVAAVFRKMLAGSSEIDAQSDKASRVRIAYSRLIVSEIFQFTVIVATVIFICVFLSYSTLKVNYRQWYEFPLPPKLVAPAFAILLMAPIIFFDRLRLGLDIAMDVVNHFVHPQSDFPIRRTIGRRFHDTLDQLTKDGERPHLLIIAHSQGSVITADALVKGLWDKPVTPESLPLKDRVATMTILTFGSPLTHIYQHYFPEDYGALSTTELRDLANDPRVKWLNVYRGDDPVGTIISGPNPDFPFNIGMPDGGHLHYWEKDVLGSADVRRNLPGGGVA